MAYFLIWPKSHRNDTILNFSDKTLYRRNIITVRPEPYSIIINVFLESFFIQSPRIPFGRITNTSGRSSNRIYIFLHSRSNR